MRSSLVLVHDSIRQSISILMRSKRVGAITPGAVTGSLRDAGRRDARRKHPTNYQKKVRPFNCGFDSLKSFISFTTMLLFPFAFLSYQFL